MFVDTPNRVLKRFCERVDHSDTFGCWEWTGTRTRDNYGVISWRSNWKRFSIGAHRIAWSLAYGVIPEGITVHHKCYNRLCCNPTHLSLLTVADNSSDNSNSRKTHCPRGHGYDYVRSSDGARMCLECCRASANRSYRGE